MLQYLFSLRSSAQGHSLLPLSVPWIIVRIREDIPPPQLTEHGDHSVQSLTPQSLAFMAQEHHRIQYNNQSVIRKGFRCNM